MSNEKYIVFDVETPNGNNDRMSAIGVCIVENGRITGDFNTLINPETHFDYNNITLTGITPAMVMKAPKFPEVWKALEPVFNGGILIAHNAPFDMGVLAKCLAGYGINWKNEAEYACTVRMSRACFPAFPNHKLNTMCSCLDIDLLHHNAGSDSIACGKVLLACMERGIDVKKYVKKYNMRRFDKY